MRLLLDEMYSPQIAAQLRKRGYDVVHAADLELAGRADADVFAAAIAERRAVVTNDAADYTLLFNRAVADGQEHFGIVLTSDRSLPRSRGGIRVFVQVLADLLERNPSERALQNEIRWLP